MQSNAAMKAFVVNLLNDNLPLFYSYHNYEHTLYVADKVLEIAHHEDCSETETELLYAAALWHDTGYISTYRNHEEEGCMLARRHLPEYNYSPGEINTICGMIMATRVPQSPKNKLEEIIADADLEYLGTENAGPLAELFFLELQHLTPSVTKSEWDRMQVAFLQKHRYFTAYCRQYKEPLKQAYLATLIKEH